MEFIGEYGLLSALTVTIWKRPRARACRGGRVGGGGGRRWLVVGEYKSGPYSFAMLSYLVRVLNLIPLGLQTKYEERECDFLSGCFVFDMVYCGLGRMKVKEINVLWDFGNNSLNCSGYGA